VSEIAQGNAASEQDPAPLRTKLFREFKGVYTQASRTAIPDGYFYNLENVIPIGEQNAHVVPNISAPLATYTDIIYWSQSVNLNGSEYLVNFSTTGKVFFYNIVTHVSTQVNVGNLLSGSGSQCDQWKNSQILFIDATGYYHYDGATFSKITGTGVPTAGNSIAVYAGRVWIVNGRLITTSAQDDYTATAFTAAQGAITTNLTDPQIRGTVQRLKAQNGYLYVIANTGINAISNVFISSGASPPTPQFSNDNIQALIGTDQPASVIAYDRLMMFASRYGIHNLFGVSAPKVSGDIDGTWQYLDFNQPISGGQVVVQNILCAAFLLKRLNDPIFGSNTVIALWFQTSDTSPQTGVTSTTDIWWFANFGALNFIVSGIINNIPALFAFSPFQSVVGKWINANSMSDGWVNATPVIGDWLSAPSQQLYQLFADPTSAPTVNIQTKLWPMEDELARKEAVTAGVEAFYYLFGSSFGLSLDTENQSTPLNLNNNFPGGNWINAAGVVRSWINVINQSGIWLVPIIFLSPADAQGGFGHHVGLTLTSTGYSYELHLLALDYKLRDRWL
jgi:hypothetical protein